MIQGTLIGIGYTKHAKPCQRMLSDIIHNSRYILPSHIKWMMFIYIYIIIIQPFLDIPTIPSQVKLE